jgi:hypothetical protein
MLNLKETYADDYKFGCDILVLLQSITSKLNEYKRIYPKLFEKESEKEEPVF